MNAPGSSHVRPVHSPTLCAIPPSIVTSRAGNGCMGVRVVANWQRTRPYTIADQIITPEGFYLTNKQETLVAGSFTTYKGAALSPGLHLLVEERTPDQITLWQPFGNAGPLAIRLPQAWSTAGEINVTAYTGAGKALSTVSATPTDGRIQIA